MPITGTHFKKEMGSNDGDRLVIKDKYQKQFRYLSLK
jgi:hypothetical protein